jgi:hypothetical protein
MSGEKQFWLNFTVNSLLALFTFGVVIVALFGDVFRKKIFPPLLSLKILHPEGEKTPIRLITTTEEGTKEREEDARFYPIQVSNQRRWSPANQTQVSLVRLEEPGPGGEWQVTWSGDIPMRWRHQEIHPTSRTIGPTADCDLCSVIKGKWLELLPLLSPLNLKLKWREGTTIIVSLQAKSNEGDSPIVRIKIAWDGEWEDGDQEMKHHLVVKELD